MLWTKEQLPLHIRSKPSDILKAGLLVANAALSKGLSQEEATFVCLQRIRSLESQLKPKVETRVVPSHIAGLLKQNILDQQAPKVIQQAFLGKNALVPNPDRSLVKADFNPRNELVLTFSTGEVIKTRAIEVNELIEQHLTVANSGSGSSSSSYFIRVNLIANTPLTITHNLGLVDQDAFCINTLSSNQQLLTNYNSIDINSIELKSAINVSNVAVTILGVQ